LSVFIYKLFSQCKDEDTESARLIFNEGVKYGELDYFVKSKFKNIE